MVHISGKRSLGGGEGTGHGQFRVGNRTNAFHPPIHSVDGLGDYGGGHSVCEDRYTPLLHGSCKCTPHDGFYYWAYTSGGMGARHIFSKQYVIEVG